MLTTINWSSRCYSKGDG